METVIKIGSDEISRIRSPESGGLAEKVAHTHIHCSGPAAFRVHFHAGGAVFHNVHDHGIPDPACLVVLIEKPALGGKKRTFTGPPGRVFRPDGRLL